MNQTSNLGLILPAPNSTCWGAEINQNFTEIDAGYAALSNQIAALRSQLGQVGIYYSDPQYTGQLVLIYGGASSDNTRPVTKAYTQILNTNGEAGDQVILYDGVKYLLESIVDFTMLVITIPNQNDQDYQFSMGGSLWSHGDIAVKITTYDATQGKNIIELRKMSQTIGGYYRPDQYQLVSGKPRTLYRRENAVQSTIEYSGPSLYVKPTNVRNNQITFQYCTANASGTETILGQACLLSYPQITTQAYTFTITTNSTLTSFKDTGIRSADYVVLDAKFWDSEQIFLDYEITTLANGNYGIHINTTYVPLSTTITVLVSYAARQAS